MSSTDSQSTDLDAAIARIASEVAESQQVDRSAELLIGSLAQQLRDAAAAAEDAASDPDAPTDESGSPVLTTLIAKLNELADGLDGSQGTLSAAVTANTPAAPDAPAPDVTPEQEQAIIDAAIEAGTVVDPATVSTPEPVAVNDEGQQVQPDPPAGEWDSRSDEEKAADEGTETPEAKASTDGTTLNNGEIPV